MVARFQANPAVHWVTDENSQPRSAPEALALPALECVAPLLVPMCLNIG
jgi:hypothetical protein